MLAWTAAVAVLALGAAYVGRDTIARLFPGSGLWFAASGETEPRAPHTGATDAVTLLDGGPASERDVAPPDAGSGAALVSVGGPTGLLAAGGRHSCLAVLGTSTYCWGANERGQLGNGTFGRRLVASPVTGDLTFTQVATGGSHTCAVTRTGDVYCWGSNTRGQLGDATMIRREAPVRVAGPGVYRTVRAGTAHTCAITTGGSIHCWGSNDRGQLGDSTRTPRTRPTPVRMTARGFSAVAVGGAHTCALSVDGTAYCWGSNDFGQLGDGTRNARPTPTAVADSLRFAAIAAGQGHTCAVTRDGVPYCWGRNSSGQLGTGTAGITTTPARVRMTAAAAVATGSFHTCMIAPGGRAFCWGRNNYGQLGDGTLLDRALPTREVALPEGIVLVDASAAHNCALGVSGRTYCWGYNGEGQLGDGTVASRRVPTVVELRPTRRVTPDTPGPSAAPAPAALSTSGAGG